MSTKSKNLAYFTDGHVEDITKFEITSDCHDIWFTTESGRWFVYKEEMTHCPVHKFYVVKFDRSHNDDFGVIVDDVQYDLTDEIEKIRICVVE